MEASQIPDPSGVAQVTTILADYLAPAMSADVAARIEAALDAEAASRSFAAAALTRRMGNLPG